MSKCVQPRRVLPLPSAFRHARRAPKSFAAALGHVLVAFSELEEEVANAIGRLVGSEPMHVQIVLAEMGFRSTLQVMKALVRHRIPTTDFNTGNADREEMFSELVS
jgi:hypothetical protein